MEGSALLVFFILDMSSMPFIPGSLRSVMSTSQCSSPSSRASSELPAVRVSYPSSVRLSASAQAVAFWSSTMNTLFAERFCGMLFLSLTSSQKGPLQGESNLRATHCESIEFTMSYGRSGAYQGSPGPDRIAYQPQTGLFVASWWAKSVCRTFWLA
jgi:hypothetical protein